SLTEVATMQVGDFYHNEQSVTLKKADVGCVAQPRTRFGSGGKNKRPSESATSAQPKPVLRFFRRPLYVFGIPFIAQTQRPIKKFDKQGLPKSVFPCIIRAHTDSKTRSRLLSP
ncbi:MAG: hypothetical protein ACFNQI_08440, partial [Eikenella corrodens]